jgi:hypothetical protein
MSAFERRYSDEQIAAAVHSYLDRKIRPAKAVLKLAREGNLLDRHGHEVPAFTMGEGYLRTLVTGERKRRRGPVKTGGMNALSNPDDVLEGLRRRMIALADSELGVCERQRQGKRDPEHMRQIARLVREVAALPKPGEGRSKTPGAKENGVQTEGRTRTGIVGQMLHAHRQGAPATELPTTEKTTAENAAQRINAAESAEQSQELSGSGSLQRSAETEAESDPLLRRIPA